MIKLYIFLEIRLKFIRYKEIKQIYRKISVE